MRKHFAFFGGPFRRKNSFDSVMIIAKPRQQDVFILPPGGFFVFSLFIAFNIWLKKKMEASQRTKELAAKKEAA